MGILLTIVAELDARAYLAGEVIATEEVLVAVFVTAVHAGGNTDFKFCFPWGDMLPSVRGSDGPFVKIPGSCKKIKSVFFPARKNQSSDRI